MATFLKFSGIILISVFLLMSGFTGCTPKPSNEEIGRLDEAKAAAESAERKLSDLRMERKKLEEQLGGAKAEEEDTQSELDEIQSDE